MASMKCLLVAFALLLPTGIQGEQFALVHIGYADGDPQGDYLLVPGKDGLVSLSPIGRGMSDAKPEGIVAEIEKSYPQMAGMITSSVVEIDTAKLVASGMVRVFGRVENPGDQRASSLAENVAAATPTPFGSVKRVMLVRKQKRLVLDLGKKSHAEMTLEPGDIVFVPIKAFYGR
jgi:hypothetical protein